jgi:hypothetical protein
VLALGPVRRGAPRLLAAADRLDTPVRWVHAIGLAAAAHLLRGGELVLSTGIALPSEVGISALAVELGPRYARSLPPALVAATAAHRLPLVMFERETAFIAITEAVHGLLIEDQVAELRAAGPASTPRRAATTLALGRLLDHQRESLERQAHRTILAAFLGHGYGDPAPAPAPAQAQAQAQARARALGAPVTGCRLLAAVIAAPAPGGG